VLTSLLHKGATRGRDSWGYTVHNTYGDVFPVRFPRPLNDGDIIPQLDGGDRIILMNNRAEPATEFVAKKSSDNIQPFTQGDVTLVHNGIIANDQSLWEYSGRTDLVAVDSIAVAAYFDTHWNGSFTNLRRCLLNIKGSFAFAIVDRRNPNRLYLAVNYQSLTLRRYTDLGMVVFSSQKENVSDGELFEELITLPAYSAFFIDMRLNTPIVSTSLRPYTEEKPKALVVCSGGMDSVTVAAKMKADGYDITLLHFLYKCKAEGKEQEAIKAIALRLGCGYMFQDISFFKDLGYSNLVDGNPINTENDGQSSAETPTEWVPARNLILLSLATGIAEAKGFKVICLGNNIEEAGTYPDNTQFFVERFRSVLPYAVGPGKEVDVMEPVGALTKREIVALAIKTNAPLDIAWSCYEGGDKHCGKCGSDYMRRHAFKNNGLIDPVEYEYIEDGFWDGCRELVMENGEWKIIE
jgi:7-cyano-7-deazaguanine synthase